MTAKFLITMIIISHLVDQGAEDGKFNNHLRCETKNLTHLCFAYNMLANFVLFAMVRLSMSREFQILVDSIQVNLVYTFFLFLGKKYSYTK